MTGPKNRVTFTFGRGTLRRVMKEYEKVEIEGALTDLNKYIQAERGNRYAGASLKRKNTDLVKVQATGKGPMKEPVMVTFHWRYSGRHDLDNIAFAKKFVLDGLAKAQVITDDSQNVVVGFSGEYFTKVKKGEEGVIVELESFEV